MAMSLMDFYLGCVDVDGDREDCEEARSRVTNFYGRFAGSCAKSKQSCMVRSRSDDGHESEGKAMCMPKNCWTEAREAFDTMRQGTGSAAHVFGGMVDYMMPGEEYDLDCKDADEEVVVENIDDEADVKDELDDIFDDDDDDLDVHFKDNIVD